MYQKENSEDVQFKWQIHLLIKNFNLTERKKLLEMSKINCVEIDAKSLVAMKADLSMPWDKMKAMSRWLKMFNISMASNAKQRVIAKEWHGDCFTVEDAPFTFPVKDKRSESRILSSKNFLQCMQDVTINSTHQCILKIVT